MGKVYGEDEAEAEGGGVGGDVRIVDDEGNVEADNGDVPGRVIDGTG